MRAYDPLVAGIALTKPARGLTLVADPSMKLGYDEWPALFKSLEEFWEQRTKRFLMIRNPNRSRRQY